ncbi:hypothetical protein HZS_4877 [Henneguya salminicola]|nr:hypothetical protein HZS_4877 [Henneguya salminicola]
MFVRPREQQNAKLLSQDVTLKIEEAKHFYEERTKQLSINDQLAPIDIYEKIIIYIKQKFARKVYAMPTKKEIAKILINCATGQAKMTTRGTFSYKIGLVLLRSNQHASIDSAFRSATYPYKQLLIVMVFDGATSIYVPSFFPS